MSSESTSSTSSTSTGYRLGLADRGIRFNLHGAGPDGADATSRGGSHGGPLFDGGTIRDASASQNINNFNLVSENVVSPFDIPFGSGSVSSNPDSSLLRETAVVPTSTTVLQESLDQFTAMMKVLIAKVHSLEFALAEQNAASTASLPQALASTSIKVHSLEFALAEQNAASTASLPQELASTSISSCGTVSSESLDPVVIPPLCDFVFESSLGVPVDPDGFLLGTDGGLVPLVRVPVDPDGFLLGTDGSLVPLVKTLDSASVAPVVGDDVPVSTPASASAEMPLAVDRTLLRTCGGGAPEVLRLDGDATLPSVVYDVGVRFCPSSSVSGLHDRFVRCAYFDSFPLGSPATITRGVAKPFDPGSTALNRDSRSVLMAEPCAVALELERCLGDAVTDLVSCEEFCQSVGLEESTSLLAVSSCIGKELLQLHTEHRDEIAHVDALEQQLLCDRIEFETMLAYVHACVEVDCASESILTDNLAFDYGLIQLGDYRREEMDVSCVSSLGPVVPPIVTGGEVELDELVAVVNEREEREQDTPAEIEIECIDIDSTSASTLGHPSLLSSSSSTFSPSIASFLPVLPLDLSLLEDQRISSVWKPSSILLVGMSASSTARSSIELSLPQIRSGYGSHFYPSVLHGSVESDISFLELVTSPEYGPTFCSGGLSPETFGSPLDFGAFDLVALPPLQLHGGSLIESSSFYASAYVTSISSDACWDCGSLLPCCVVSCLQEETGLIGHSQDHALFMVPRFPPSSWFHSFGGSLIQKEPIPISVSDLGANVLRRIPSCCRRFWFWLDGFLDDRASVRLVTCSSDSFRLLAVHDAPDCRRRRLECCVSCFWVRQSLLGQVARWSPLELSYFSATHLLVVDVGRRFTPFEVGEIQFFVPLVVGKLRSLMSHDVRKSSIASVALSVGDCSIDPVALSVGDCSIDPVAVGVGDCAFTSIAVRCVLVCEDSLLEERYLELDSLYTDTKEKYDALSRVEFKPHISGPVLYTDSQTARSRIKVAFRAASASVQLDDMDVFVENPTSPSEGASESGAAYVSNRPGDFDHFDAILHPLDSVPLERLADAVRLAPVSGYGRDAVPVGDESVAVGDESSCVVGFSLSSFLLLFLRVVLRLSVLVFDRLALALGVRDSVALVALLTLDASVSGVRLTLLLATLASLVFCVPEGAYMQGFDSIETTAGVESSWDFLEIPLKMTSWCSRLVSSSFGILEVYPLPFFDSWRFPVEKEMLFSFGEVILPFPAIMLATVSGATSRVGLKQQRKSLFVVLVCWLTLWSPWSMLSLGFVALLYRERYRSELPSMAAFREMYRWELPSKFAFRRYSFDEFNRGCLNLCLQGDIFASMRRSVTGLRLCTHIYGTA